ncbi:hypothetical protein [Kitasatospora sp. NPDC059571]|uniref:hypothetical protein n=1 Tax=Kitasatospora sp. NPDC059571 TaxID=3346871 RepID=UPI0036837960
MTSPVRVGGSFASAVAPAWLSVTAEFDGVMPCTRFAGLSEAAEALVAALRQCRMGQQQRAYAEGCLIGPGANEVITASLLRHGAWSLTVYLIEGEGTASRWAGHSVFIRAPKTTGGR